MYPTLLTPSLAIGARKPFRANSECQPCWDAGGGGVDCGGCGGGFYKPIFLWQYVVSVISIMYILEVARRKLKLVHSLLFVSTIYNEF